MNRSLGILLNKSNLIEIYGPIKKELLQIEKRLHTLLSRDADKYVAEIGNYILKKPGKRLRPALVLLSARLGSSIKPKVIDLAAAIELIHTATLIHDDIIDRAEKRRSQKSVNIKYGRDAAILFGDFLYSKAFELIASLNSVPIIMLLLKNAGTICRGEIEQLHKPQNSIMKINDYLKIIEEKTASLFATCCEAGAILSGSSGKNILALKQYGHNLGMGFQIIDDYLDMAGDEPRVGKEVAVKYCNLAASKLSGIRSSAAKSSLIKLSGFVLGQAN